jgi:1-deoxy-D-xylulose-5-phosphate reductoisomerase
VPIALANKETIVAGGGIILREAGLSSTKIIPVDSEHSAVLDCIGRNKKRDIKRIILTASGGPFADYTAERLKNVTAADALKHPTWSMGKKITVDSATMMNKGLEIIEAAHLFSLPESRIDVAVHRESIVHSLVEFKDNSMTAVLAAPDMRIPVSRALGLLAEAKADNNNCEDADRLFNNAPPLGLIGRSLTFSAPDEELFPCLKIARYAARAGGIMPAAMNAANSLAVADFLKGRLSFGGIYKSVERVLEKTKNYTPETSGDIFEADRRAAEIYNDKKIR